MAPIATTARIPRILAAVMAAAVAAAAAASTSERASASGSAPAPAPVAAADSAASTPSTTASIDSLRDEVRKAEIAFARTMAARDHAAFVTFLADEAIFVGPRRTLRGRQEVAEGWKRLYEGPQAPFSWAPQQVEVIASGTLALSSGPVKDPSGKRVGTYNSTWRREPDGAWKIVLDNGCPECECQTTPKTDAK